MVFFLLQDWTGHNVYIDSTSPHTYPPFRGMMSCTTSHKFLGHRMGREREESRRRLESEKAVWNDTKKSRAEA